jgi:hypothetical protein
MKISILVDTIVRDFMKANPNHSAVLLFTVAWQHFMFNQDPKEREALNDAMIVLQKAAKGQILLVATDDHGAPLEDDEIDNDSGLDGVTFH